MFKLSVLKQRRDYDLTLNCLVIHCHGYFIKGLWTKKIIFIRQWDGNNRLFNRCKTKGENISLRTFIKTIPKHTDAILRYGNKEVVHSVTTEVFLRQVPLAVKVITVKRASNPLIPVYSSNSIPAQDNIQLYANWSSIETAIEQIKGPLGWKDNQCDTHLAFHRSVNLVCFAGPWCKTISLYIPICSWIEGFCPKPYIIQMETSFGLICQVIRQYALQKLVFSKLAQQAKLRKKYQATSKNYSACVVSFVVFDFTDILKNSVIVMTRTKSAKVILVPRM
jgi:hypothetical protein